MANDQDKEYFTAKVLPRTLKFEGGGTNPNDGGSKSVWGIRQDVYNNWAKQKGKPMTDVAELTHGDRNDYAYDEFYTRPKINKLQDGIKELAFDYNFNSGGKAIKDLQALVGAEADGVIGKQTLKAIDGYIKTNTIDKLKSEYLKARENNLLQQAVSTPTGRASINGWMNRINALRSEFTPQP